MNCVGMTENGDCNRLNVKKCMGSICNFFQTKEQDAIAKQKAFKRIATLDKDLQSSISDKYFNGKQPWIDK